MVYCVYLSELPHQWYIVCTYQNRLILHVKENREDIPIMPPDLVL